MAMAADRTGRNRVIAGAGLHHVALRVADFESTLRFYCDGLGFCATHRWTEDGQPAAMLDAGDGTCLEVYGGGRPDEQAAGRLLHFALRTTDCDAAVERARAAGARITQEPQTLQLYGESRVTTVRLAFCSGPDGEAIEFLQGM